MPRHVNSTHKAVV